MSDPNDVMTELKRLADAFPEDMVSLEVRLDPSGNLTFVGWIPAKPEIGLQGIYRIGASARAAAEEVIREATEKGRDLKKARQNKITELENSIAALKALDEKSGVKTV